MAAFLVHGLVLAAVLWQPARSGAASVGSGGIEVALGPAGGAPGGPIASSAETSEPDEAHDAVDDKAMAEAFETAARDDAVEPPPIDTPAALDLPQPEPVEIDAPLPELYALPDFDSQPTPRPLAAPLSQTGPEEIVERSETARADVVPAPLPAAKPDRVPEPVDETVAAQAAEPVVAPTSSVGAEGSAGAAGEPASALEGAGGKAGTDAARDAGSSTDASSGGSPGEKADYMALLLAWLEKHKEYPQRAQLRHEEGTALLYFVIDRAGHVLDYRITQSSGHDLLDQEARAMIERAQPLPPIPDSMQAGRLELIVPVQFFLR